MMQRDDFGKKMDELDFKYDETVILAMYLF